MTIEKVFEMVYLDQMYLADTATLMAQQFGHLRLSDSIFQQL